MAKENISPIQQLEQEQQLLQRRIPRWQSRLDRVGVKGTIIEGSSIKNSLRVGKARASITPRIQRNVARLEEVTQTLNTVSEATEYLKELESKSELMREVRIYAEGGFISPEVLEQHEEELRKLQSRPQNEPLLQHAIALIQDDGKDSNDQSPEPVSNDNTDTDTINNSDPEVKARRKRIIKYAPGEASIELMRSAFGIGKGMTEDFEEMMGELWPELTQQYGPNYRRSNLLHAIGAVEKIIENPDSKSFKILMKFVEDEVKRSPLFMALTSDERRVVAQRQSGWKEIVDRVMQPKQDTSIQDPQNGPERVELQDFTTLQTRIMIRALDHDAEKYKNGDIEAIICDVWQSKFVSISDSERIHILNIKLEEFLEEVSLIIKTYGLAVAYKKQGIVIPRTLGTRYMMVQRDPYLNYLSIDELEQAMLRELSFDEVRQIAFERSGGLVGARRNGVGVDVVPPSDDAPVRIENPETPLVSSTEETDTTINNHDSDNAENNDQGKNNQLRGIEKRDPEIRTRVRRYLEEISKNDALKGEEFTGDAITMAIGKLTSSKIRQMTRRGDVKPLRNDGLKLYFDTTGITAMLYLNEYGRNLPPQMRKDIPGLINEVIEEVKEEERARRGKRPDSRVSNEFFDRMFSAETQAN